MYQQFLFVAVEQMLNVHLFSPKAVRPLLTLLENFSLYDVNTHSSASMSLSVSVLDHCTESLRLLPESLKSRYQRVETCVV